MENIKRFAEDVYYALQPYCIAIYLGGSYCQDYIKNKGDVDFICFADKPVDMCHIRRLLYFYFKKNNCPENYDFIQVRTKQREEHAYRSYINKEMIKLVGQDLSALIINPVSDISALINLIFGTSSDNLSSVISLS